LARDEEIRLVLKCDKSGARLLRCGDDYGVSGDPSGGRSLNKQESFAVYRRVVKQAHFVLNEHIADHGC
jgi:hypothetical protein